MTESIHTSWRAGGHRPILLIALFCTAFSSLVYELVWSRELSYVFGSTALAASSILAVFMAGLALGSLYGARILETRPQPYRFLALLQCGIGVSCILTLSAINGVDRLQDSLLALTGGQATLAVQIVLFGLTSLVLIVPTFLIGAAFPCIVQLYHSRDALVGQSVSRCYWVDTLGAALGMSLAAFLLVPTLGLLKTSLTASSLNLLTGLLLLGLLRRADEVTEEPAPEARDESATPTDGFGATIIHFLFFLSGFSALLLEIIWIRHVGLTYGSGLHAFAIVVVIFLLGLSLGSAVYEAALKRVRNQVVLFSVIELCLGASALLVTALFPHMEIVFLRIYFGVETYSAFVILLSLVCFALLLIPTMLMGMTLPALCTITASDRRIGNDFGRLYAVNSAGALTGSFCAGFVIIPALGIYYSSFLAAGIYFFIAFAFLLCFADSRSASRGDALSFVAVLIVTVALLAVLHKPNHLYNGAFYSGIMWGEDRYRDFLERQKKLGPVTRFRETGVYGQVVAYGNKRSMVLNQNGRIDSSTGSESRAYQLMLGHIPMLIHERPSRVLIIGLGAGWTVNAVVEHPGTDSVECVELNPLIVDVTRNVFYAYNDDVLNHPKVKMFVNDGRNYVEQADSGYAVIISEPPEFWFSGVSALFTAEFYTHAKRILTPDGLFLQWFPRYEITERNYKIALNTIKHVFPFAYEFDMAKITGDRNYQSFLVMASKNPIDVAERLRALKRDAERDEGQQADRMLELIRVAETTITRDNGELEDYIADVEVLHTDDLPVLEFQAARDRFRKFRAE